MAPLTVLAARKRTSTGRLAKNSKLFKSIIKAISEKKGESIVSLDLRKIPEAVADFFVICQATSHTQIRAISNFVEETVKEECGELPYKHDSYQAQQQWIIIDYINIVVHVLLPDARKFYRLEEMWSDAVFAEHN